VSIGVGTRIWHQVHVREGAKIGCNCNIGKDVYIDSDVVIGDRVKIQNASLLYHGLVVEDGAFIGPGAMFLNDKRPRAINPDGTAKSTEDWEVSAVRIKYGAAIGGGAVVLPGITVGRMAMVGAGAVVSVDVPDHALVQGNPARITAFVCLCGGKAGSWVEDGDHMIGVCPDRHLEIRVEKSHWALMF